MLPRTAVTLASRSHTPRRFVYRHTDRSPHSPSSLFSLPAWRVPRGSDRPRRTLVVSPSLGQGQITLQYSWEENEGQWKDFVGIGTVTLGIQNVPGLHYQIWGEGSIYVHPAVRHGWPGKHKQELQPQRATPGSLLAGRPEKLGSGRKLLHTTSQSGAQNGRPTLS